jgi:hypothetical protein
MSAFVETIDSNHLLTIGLKGFYGHRNPESMGVISDGL